MGVKMGADKPIVAHGALQRTHPGHALGRVQAGQGAEAMRVLLNRPRHDFIGQMPAARQAQLTGFGGHQQGALNARAVH